MTFLRCVVCSEILAPSIIYSRSKHTRAGRPLQSNWIRKCLSRATVTRVTRKLRKLSSFNEEERRIIFVRIFPYPRGPVPPRPVHERISQTGRVRARVAR